MAKLYFYYSAMNAGKTTVLLQTDYNYRERGMETFLFTPIIDTRYEPNQITSRIGLKSAAIAFERDFNFLEYVKNQITEHQKKRACILLDEAHFLTKAQVEQLCMIVDYLHIPVLTYGLRSDFQGEPFEGSKYLLIFADHLNEIKTICHCGKKATMNMRINESGEKVLIGEQVEIGGNDRYVATCRRHFLEGDGGAKEQRRRLPKDIDLLVG